MKLLTFTQEDTLVLGIKTSQGIYPSTMRPEAFYQQGLAALPALRAELAEARGGYILEEGLELGPCVPNPGKIICVGLNYKRHAKESGMAVPKTPVLFSKFNTSLAAAGEAVPLPACAQEYDYEAELVVVIGKRAKDISEAEALSYVLGYCNGNDVSARDLQMLTGQWLLGKTLDKFMPIGPYVVTADEAGDPQAMSVRCWLNGELRQDSNTADMIFSVAYIVSYISRYMTLEPGDIISTGTPEGVILGMEDKAWLTSGDQIVVEIGGLGSLGNMTL